MPVLQNHPSMEMKNFTIYLESISVLMLHPNKVAFPLSKEESLILEEQYNLEICIHLQMGLSLYILSCFCKLLFVA